MVVTDSGLTALAMSLQSSMNKFMSSSMTKQGLGLGHEEMESQVTPKRVSTVDDIYALLLEMRQENLQNFGELRQDVAVMTERVQVLEDENTNLKRRVDLLEKEVRGRNLIFGGERLKDSENLDSEIRNIVKELGLPGDALAIGNIIRLPKGPILVKLIVEMEKQAILDAMLEKSKDKTAPAGVWIKPDRTKESRDIRKKLSKYYMNAKTQGKMVKVVNNHIIIDDVKFCLNKSEDGLVCVE